MLFPLVDPTLWELGENISRFFVAFTFALDGIDTTQLLDEAEYYALCDTELVTLMV